MNSTLFLLALLDGATQAALLALVALGLTLIFGVMSIVNVAHGSFYAFGGYAAARLSMLIATGDSIPMSLLALVLAAALMGVLLGVVIEFGLVRRILNFDPVMQLLATFCLGTVMGTLGGALASPTTSLMPGIGGDMMVISFAVVAVAGLGQITGTAVAALLIGMGKSFSIYLLPEIDVLVPYLIMFAVLLWRPQGLFAVAEARRV